MMVRTQELGGEERPAADISAIFGLGGSGGSDVAAHKHEYVGDAVEAEFLRKTGQDDRRQSAG